MRTDTLRLTLKKKWFDMIASGEKKEEYREIKPYWMRRLQAWGNAFDECRDFNFIEFRNGYSRNSPVIMTKCEGIKIGYGKAEWGAIGETYIISIGEIINKSNLKLK